MFTDPNPICTDPDCSHACDACEIHNPEGVGACIMCGTVAKVCCADYDEHGNYQDALCVECCGPHTPFNPQIVYYPQG